MNILSSSLWPGFANNDFKIHQWLAWPYGTNNFFQSVSKKVWLYEISPSLAVIFYYKLGVTWKALYCHVSLFVTSVIDK